MAESPPNAPSATDLLPMRRPALRRRYQGGGATLTGSVSSSASSPGSFSVPFSWEHSPGIPKAEFLLSTSGKGGAPYRHQRFPDVFLLPLPPALRTNSDISPSLRKNRPGPITAAYGGSFAIPFSWEFSPGGAAAPRQKLHEVLLPLTHTLRSNSDISHVRKNRRPDDDPFAIALAQCAKDRVGAGDELEEEGSKEAERWRRRSTLSPAKMASRFRLLRLCSS